MSELPRVLIVASDMTGASAVEAALASKFRVTAVRAFDEALDIILSEPPDALVTELKLGAFNGLHLIIRLRGRSPDSVSVVYTAFPDPVLERQAHVMGADYLARETAPSALVELLSDRLSNRVDRRRHGRKRLADPIAASIADVPAQFVDVSHTGFCVDLACGLVESPVQMSLPDHDVLINARVVWASRTSDGRGGLRIGATLSDPTIRDSAQWRQLVDSASFDPVPVGPGPLGPVAFDPGLD